MNKTQEEKFEKWFLQGDLLEDRRIALNAWQACLEANGIGEDYSKPPKAPCGHDADKPCDCELNREEPRIPEGYFKIGEKLRFRKKGREEWSNGTVYIHAQLASESYWGDDIEAIRIPSWNPKDGEAVFVNLIEGIQVAKVLSADDGNVVQVLFSQGERRAVELARLKPLDASKIGKPWSEI